MARELEGRVRYDKATDSFVYEIRAVDEEAETYEDWGMSAVAKCWKREGAEDGEGTDFIHFDFMKTIVRDCWLYGVSVHLA